MHHVYRVDNIKNGRVYIGYTSRPPFLRWYHHYKDIGNAENHLADAIQEHGIESFSFRVLASFETREEALEYERLTIIEADKEVSLYNSYHAESKRKPMPKPKRTLREEKNGLYEFREAKKVYAWNYKTGEFIGEYSSANECARVLSVHSSEVSRIASGTMGRSSKGYTFSYSPEKHEELFGPPKQTVNYYYRKKLQTDDWEPVGYSDDLIEKGWAASNIVTTFKKNQALGTLKHKAHRHYWKVEKKLR
ncbi:GIY-YIG nuclease family protein [Exiguobacterium aurantiacum]|uniref:GIY-YIG nuclease family protein n=1 Tax=Exiguobacterium aurantiacum TaxID=33987 RepID=UPI00384C2C5B